MINIIDDTLIQEFFKHEENAKIIFAFFHRNKIKAVVASNIYNKLINNPIIKKDEETLARLKLILKPFGENSYSGLSFDEATINAINIHSNIGEVHFISCKQLTLGTDETKEIIKRKNLIISNSTKVVDILRYSFPKFIEWYESLELLKIQKMDPDVKKEVKEKLEAKIEQPEEKEE